MRPRTCRFVTCRFAAAISIVIALTVAPLSLGAQGHQFRDTPLTILQTTDIHHHANGVDHVGLDVDPITGTSVVGSYARIASYVNYVRQTAGHPVVLVDSGDWTMGTLYDLTLGSRPLALEFLRRMNYDCITLGNHEFDYTPTGLAQIFTAAQNSFGFHTPIVASNMNLNGDPHLGAFFGPNNLIQSTRVEVLPGGLKIGYIGLMGKGAALDAPGSAPITFTDFSTNYAAIQALVNDLRNNQGAQVVIALSHSGTDASGNFGEDVNLAKHVTGINVIASGHTHTPLSAVHTVADGVWNTQIIDAGAYGTNVFRIDLTYHGATQTTTVDGAINAAMTNAGLNAIHAGLGPDPSISLLVENTDKQLNVALGPFFTQTFPDYDPTRVGKGIYHPVGFAAQNMVSNGINPIPSPNGLGDLVADAVRNVPNSIIAQTFAAVGGNPANLPGYDFTPFQAGLEATGLLRSKLLAGVPLSFTDVYNVTPLGISPDSSQALPVGYPMISTYIDVNDVKKICALQLVVQTNLASADFYINLSGLQYSLKGLESGVFFKYATAAAVLQVTSQKAGLGSTSALQALGALSTLGADSGAALLTAYAGGNPYATAMVKLNDTSPTLAQIAANLGVLGQVATDAATDSALGTNTLNTLIVSKAVDAIDTVSGFAANDPENTGAVTPLPTSGRIRASADLFAILLIGAVQTRFGVTITPYQAATGTVVLSSANFPAILANRIDAAPGTPGVQELKEWESVLFNLDGGLGGFISSDYASTANFADFFGDGVAVKIRNDSYPIAGIGQFATTVAGLQSAP